MAQRDFTKFLVLATLACAAGQVWILPQNLWRRAGGRPPIRAVARLDEIRVGGSLTFRYPDQGSPAVLVRLGKNRLVAFDEAGTMPDLGPKSRPPQHSGTTDAMFRRAT